MEHNEALQLVDDHLNHPAPDIDDFDLVGIDNNDQDDIDEVPWMYREDLHYRGSQGLLWYIGVVGCLCIGLIGYILMFQLERIVRPQCSIQFDLLMVVGLATVAAMCIIVMGIHLVRINDLVMNSYVLLSASIAGFTGFYPLGLLTTLWISAKHCEQSMPTILKVIYWTVTALLCLPSFVYFCGLVFIGIYLPCTLTQIYRYEKRVKRSRKFNQQLIEAIIKFTTCSERAPKPHMLYKEYTDDGMGYSTLYLQQEKNPRLSMLILYFSRIFSNLTIDLEAVEDQRQEIANKADLNDSQHAETLNGSLGLGSDEIVPKPRTKYFEALACPECLDVFVKQSEVIESPCCTQCYHQDCLLSKMTHNEQCKACESHILISMAILLKRAANKEDAKNTQILGNLNTDM